MILVDTSVWVSHFRYKNPQLKTLLMKGQVISHVYIIGELACGHLENRKEILSLMEVLPKATLANHKEILHFIDQYQLMGTGLGYVDVHLLASALLSSVLLWTNDQKLKQAADKMGIGFL